MIGGNRQRTRMVVTQLFGAILASMLLKTCLEAAPQTPPESQLPETVFPVPTPGDPNQVPSVVPSEAVLPGEAQQNAGDEVSADDDNVPDESKLPADQANQVDSPGVDSPGVDLPGVDSPGVRRGTRRSPMVWGHCDPGCDSICKGTQESFARWTPFHKLIQLQPLSRPVKTKICTSGNAAPSRRTAGFIVARYVGPSFVAPEGESIQFRCGELKLPWRGTVQQAG